MHRVAFQVLVEQFVGSFPKTLPSHLPSFKRLRVIPSGDFVNVMGGAPFVHGPCSVSILVVSVVGDVGMYLTFEDLLRECHYNNHLDRAHRFAIHLFLRTLVVRSGYRWGYRYC